MLLIKVLFIKKHITLFISLLKMKKPTLPHEFIFVFIRYFTGAILSEKFCQKRSFQKKYNKGGWGADLFIYLFKHLIQTSVKHLRWDVFRK